MIATLPPLPHLPHLKLKWINLCVSDSSSGLSASSLSPGGGVKDSSFSSIMQAAGLHTDINIPARPTSAATSSGDTHRSGLHTSPMFHRSTSPYSSSASASNHHHRPSPGAGTGSNSGSSGYNSSSSHHHQQQQQHRNSSSSSSSTSRGHYHSSSSSGHSSSSASSLHHSSRTVSSSSSNTASNSSNVSSSSNSTLSGPPATFQPATHTGGPFGSVPRHNQPQNTSSVLKKIHIAQYMDKSTSPRLTLKFQRSAAGEKRKEMGSGPVSGAPSSSGHNTMSDSPAKRPKIGHSSTGPSQSSPGYSGAGHEDSNSNSNDSEFSKNRINVESSVQDSKASGDYDSRVSSFSGSSNTSKRNEPSGVTSRVSSSDNTNTNVRTGSKMDTVMDSSNVDSQMPALSQEAQSTASRFSPHIEDISDNEEENRSGLPQNSPADVSSSGRLNNSSPTSSTSSGSSFSRLKSKHKESHHHHHHPHSPSASLSRNDGAIDSSGSPRSTKVQRLDSSSSNKSDKEDPNKPSSSSNNSNNRSHSKVSSSDRENSRSPKWGEQKPSQSPVERYSPKTVKDPKPALRIDTKSSQSPKSDRDSPKSAHSDPGRPTSPKVSAIKKSSCQL